MEEYYCNTHQGTCYSCPNWDNCRDQEEHLKEDIDSVYLEELRRENEFI